MSIAGWDEGTLQRWLEAQLSGAGAIGWNVIAGKPSYPLISQTTEPPDANLANSQLVIWLDDTPGTTIAKFKAKDSAGTVVTADVALS